MNPITNCKVEFAFQCPNIWANLKKTESPLRRYCGVCNRHVHLCISLWDLHHHASQGHCIAVPPGLDDLYASVGEPDPRHRYFSKQEKTEEML